MPEVNRPAARLVLLATGFGGGEHFAQVLEAWRRRGPAVTPPAGGDEPRALDWHAAHALHYIAVLPVLPPASALVFDELRGQWPVAVPGLHRLTLDGGAVTLDLLAGDLETGLQQLQARVDAFYLPQADVPWRALAKLALPGAPLAMHGAGDAALSALRSAGFTQAAASWPWLAAGGAVCATFTSRKPQAPRAAAPERRAIVIGAGMAGAAICERLAARGWDITLVERHGLPAQEASGNRSGIFMPLLSRDDNIPTRLTRAAYLYAMRRWQALGGLQPQAPVGAEASGPIAGSQCGVLQLARDAGHAQLQREIVAAGGYPDDYVRWLDAAEAGRLLGVATPDGGWLFGQGGWANPASICRAMFDACGVRLTRLYHAEAITLARTGGLWQVLDNQARVLAEAPNVILANSAGARSLAQTAELPLYTMRGQVTHLDAAAFPQLPLVVCREAYITPSVHGIVSAGATYDTDTDAALRAASQQENLARAAEILPGALGQLAESAPLAGRVAFRCMAPDRLPLVGALPDYGAVGAVANERLPLVGALPDYGAVGAVANERPPLVGALPDYGAVGAMANERPPLVGALPDYGAVGAMANERPPLVGALPDYGAVGAVANERPPLVGALPDYGAVGAITAPRKVERLRDVPRYPGLYGLLGYASRGLIWAPFAAEILAAQLENEPLPLEATLAEALDPGRFLLKSLKKI